MNLKKTSIFYLFLLVLVGCGEAETEDGSESSNSGNIIEYYNVYAERQLVIDINLPYDISALVDYEQRPQHSNCTHSFTIDVVNKKIYYLPDSGYIGEDEIKLSIYKNGSYGENGKTFTYKININKPIVEGNRDFTTSISCETISGHLTNSRLSTYNIDITNNYLEKKANIYTDKKVKYSYSNIIPEFSRIETDYYYSDTENIDGGKSKKHHDYFLNNIQDNMMVSCNYENGQAKLIFPINDKKWNATEPSTNPGCSPDFSRNDLHFHVSSLSTLHSKIYLKNYKNGISRENSYKNANKFMDSIFPGSHYTAELMQKYESKNWWSYYQKRKENSYKFDNDNSLYYERIQYLADSVTNGNVDTLLEKIVENYSSYYMYDQKQCTDHVICGTLFPEYSVSVTKNPSFESSFENWESVFIVEEPSTADITYTPEKKTVNMELLSDLLGGSGVKDTYLSLFQTAKVDNDFDDFFLKFDLEDLYGGSTSPFGGYSSSGFAGVYACFFGISNTRIGCTTWSDRTNKSLIFEGSNVVNHESFYNQDLHEVVRRVRPAAKRLIYITHLNSFLKKNVEKIYELRNSIKYIEYGIFATEVRESSGRCFRCDAYIEANEINLLKKK